MKTKSSNKISERNNRFDDTYTSTIYAYIIDML